MLINSWPKLERLFLRQNPYVYSVTYCETGRGDNIAELLCEYVHVRTPTHKHAHVYICTQQKRKICSDICLKELMYIVCIYVSFMCIGTYMYGKLLLVYFNLYQHALFHIFFLNSELLNGIRIGLKNRIS